MDHATVSGKHWFSKENLVVGFPGAGSPPQICVYVEMHFMVMRESVHTDNAIIM